MSKGIVISIITGILAGFFFLTDAYLGIVDIAVTCTLMLLAITVGIDFGMQDNLVSEIIKEGPGLLLIPIAMIIGSLIMGACTALILPYNLGETLAVSAGLGWYSLVPAMLLKYSTELSAVSFLHNVLRETLGIILIPVVAKKLGFMESLSLPGAGCMDVCLPIIRRSTTPKIAVYAFVTGVLLTLTIPVILTAIMNIFLV